MDGIGGHQRVAFAMGISDHHPCKGIRPYEDLTMVCMDDSAWGGCLRGDDVHVRMEGGDEARGHMEGSSVWDKESGEGKAGITESGSGENETHVIIKDGQMLLETIAIQSRFIFK